MFYDVTMVRFTPKTIEQNEFGSQLNSLRAAVLGANDGIVSVGGLVLGLAGATTSKSIIFTAGLAGLVAGALSMAVGEYISVSSQRDTEKTLLQKERRELREDPKGELNELAQHYQSKGLSAETAMEVAKELTKHDVFAAHVETELGIDPQNLTNPVQAAVASAASFLSGAIVPLVVTVLLPASTRVPLTFLAVLIALVITGLLSAKVSGANTTKATFRVVVGGAVAMAITYSIGRLFGINV